MAKKGSNTNTTVVRFTSNHIPSDRNDSCMGAKRSAWKSEEHDNHSLRRRGRRPFSSTANDSVNENANANTNANANASSSSTNCATSCESLDRPPRRPSRELAFLNELPKHLFTDDSSSDDSMSAAHNERRRHPLSRNGSGSGSGRGSSSQHSSNHNMSPRSILKRRGLIVDEALRIKFSENEINQAVAVSDTLFSKDLPKL